MNIFTITLLDIWGQERTEDICVQLNSRCPKYSEVAQNIKTKLEKEGFTVISVVHKHGTIQPLEELIEHKAGYVK
jgi:uncharacterized protein (DUF302 family)